MTLSIHSCIVVIAMLTLGTGARGQASCMAAFTPGVSQLAGVDHAFDCAFFDHGSGPVLYVTGSTTIAGGMPVSRIARWDGLSWSDVGGGLNGAYGNRFAVHDDGSGPALYVVGSFTAAGGVPANNVARWNGTNWSPVGPGLPVAGHSLAGGVVGGVPSLFAATLAASSGVVFRWTGSTWTQIATADNQIKTLVIEDLGSGPKLYVGGSFSNIAGIAASKIASFDGTAWQALGSGIPGQPFFDHVDACRAFGGDLFVGGDFPSAPGITANIARWNGVQWLSGGMTSSLFVNDFAIFDDGSGPAIYATGAFATVGSGNYMNFGRWTGSGWVAVGGGIQGAGNIRMATFDTPGSGGLLALAGDLLTAVNWYPTFSGTPVNHVATWNGLNWSVLGNGFNASTLCATSWNGEMLVGGNFTQIPGGTTTNGVARWNGSAWSGFGAGPPGQVRDLLPSSLGGPGLFAALNNATLSRWNGTTWQVPGTAPPFGAVRLAEHASPSGPVVVAATATVPIQLKRWDGIASWTTIGGLSGTGAYVADLADDPFGTNLLIGGLFTSGGLSNLVAWNGTSLVNPPFAWNSSLEVRCMKVLDDGGGPVLFIVGRNPGTYPSVPPSSPYLHRWNGTSLTLIGTFDLGSDVTDLEIVAESTGPVLHATGYFNTIDGAPVSRIGRRVGGSWFAVPGTSQADPMPLWVQGFSEGGSSAVYLGGVGTGSVGPPFTSFAGVSAAYLTRFGCPRSSLALTQSGGAGSPVGVTSSGLVAGRETFNVFSVEPCAGIPGSGPLLGLCATDPTTLLAQALLPVGTLPFHFLASQPSMTFGPYAVPALIVDGLCIDLDAASGYRWSPVTRVTIQ